MFLQNVCDRILEHWQSLTLFFQKAALEDDLPMAKSILNALSNPLFKLYLQFMAFNLDTITKLNVEFQGEKPKTPILLDKIVTLYKTFLKYFVKKDIINSESINNVVVSNPRLYKDINDIYLGAKVDMFLKNPSEVGKISSADLHNFKVRCLDFYVEMCKQLKKRFDFSNKHLQFAGLFKPTTVLSGKIISISEFAYLFPNIKVDPDLVNSEWQLISEYKELKEKDLDLNNFWATVAKTKNELGELMFPNLMVVVKHVLCIPHSSAAAERIFSQLNVIKNKLRNRFQIDTCAHILALKENIRTGFKMPKRG